MTPDNASTVRARRRVRLALAAVAVVWVALRFWTLPADPPRAASDALAGVDVVASAETGRLRTRGWPEALEDLELDERPEVRAAATRLLARVAAANESLAELATAVTRRVERLPDGTAGLRVAGLLVVFPGTDGERLLACAAAPPDRAYDTLNRLAALLEARLEEPPALDQLESAVTQRELLRLHREIRDALEAKAAGAAEDVARFRSESLEAVRREGGFFLRHGRGVLVEIVAASALGVLLREALRRRPSAVPFLVAACVGPMAAIGAVTALAGSAWLPVHPLFGLTPAFVPLAFGIGWLAPTLLALVVRLDRPDEELAPDPPTPKPVPAGAPLPAPPAVPRPRSEAPPQGSAPAPGPGAPLPFFPKRRPR